MFTEQKYGAARKLIYLLFLLCAIGIVFVAARMIIMRMNGNMTLITADESVCDNADALAELKRDGVPIPRACDE